MRAAIYSAIDICRNRRADDEARRSPLRRLYHRKALTTMCLISRENKMKSICNIIILLAMLISVSCSGKTSAAAESQSVEDQFAERGSFLGRLGLQLREASGRLRPPRARKRCAQGLAANEAVDQLSAYADTVNSIGHSRHRMGRCKHSGPQHLRTLQTRIAGRILLAAHYDTRPWATRPRQRRPSKTHLREPTTEPAVWAYCLR